MNLQKLLLGEDENPLEKVVKVYKAILCSEKRDVKDTGNNQKNQLNDIISNIYTDFNYAELFSNCLACIKMDVKTIRGQNLEGKTRFWNQVKIYDYWYNIDIFLDAKKQFDKKSIDKKPKYFLINDKEFYKDHKVKSTNYEHCLYSIDKKIINKYFKDEKANYNWFTSLLKKIKQLFLFNENSAKTLPAPSGNVVKDENNNFSEEELDIINQIDDLD